VSRMHECLTPCFPRRSPASAGRSTLSLHDALPISACCCSCCCCCCGGGGFSGGRCSCCCCCLWHAPLPTVARRPLERLLVCSLRSEEHTSELQSRETLVCSLLLEQKKLPAIIASAC